MDFANGDQPLTRRVEREVGKARAGSIGDPLWRSARLEAIDLLVLVIDEIDRLARDQELAAAILMHPRARRERRGQHLLDGPTLCCSQDHLASTLLGPRLAPIDRAAGHLDHAKTAACPWRRVRA
jgi:hypothetical protein